MIALFSFRGDECEKEWWLAHKVDVGAKEGVRGYIPRNYLGVSGEKKGWRAGRVSGTTSS